MVMSRSAREGPEAAAMSRAQPDEAGGFAEHRVDSAGRIVLSKDQREMLGYSEVYIYIWWADCLRVAAANGLNEDIEVVERTFGHDRFNLELALRRTVGTARKQAIDNNGRLRIPRFHLQFLRVEPGGQVLVVPVDWRVGILEIWNPDTFREQVLARDFRQLLAAAPEPAESAEAG